MEKITCSAVHYLEPQENKMVHLPRNIDEGIVIAGHRHCNCLEVLGIIYGKVDQTMVIQ